MNGSPHAGALANPGLKTPLARLALDLLCWFLIPGLFLSIYTTRFRQPLSAVWPHLQVAAIPLLVLLAVRILSSRLPGNPIQRRWLLAMVAALFLAALCLYYTLALVGLASWGGVVTWNVIPTFFAQVAVMTDELGVPEWVLPLISLALGAALIQGCRWYLARFDWVEFPLRRTSWPTVTVIIGAIAAIVAVQIYQVGSGHWIRDAEPVSLTFQTHSVTLDLEGYSVNPVTASRQDRRDEQARRAYAPRRGAHRNLVLIVVDALRPDHMEIYGYNRATTPGLARIARERNARIVTGLHSSCADTLCGLFSLFSSKYPNDFGLHPFLLHEVLHANGYRNYQVLSGDQTYFMKSRDILYGASDHFYDGNMARGYFLNDDQLVLDHVAALQDWDGRPTFIQVHLMSAHILRKPADHPGEFQPEKRYALRLSQDRGPGGQPEPLAINFYDNGVLRADEVISELLATLQRKGYLKDTLVAVTADHGDSLGEHGLFAHANSVREEVLRIPLVLIPFGYESNSDQRARPFPSQVDIAPTLLAELSVPVPATWEGHSIYEQQSDPLSTFEEHWFAGLIDRRDPQHVWKYWIDRKTQTDHLFDLRADTHEDQDVRGQVRPELLQELRELTRERTSAGLH